jgi:hypothetical protein
MNAARRRPVAPRREIDGSTATRADQAELLQITSPAGFEAFIAEAGEPAAEPVVPPPAEPDIAKLLTTQARVADETPLLQGGRKPYLVVAIRTYPEP